MAIIPRYSNCNTYDSDCNYYGTSPWYNYGRWILLGAIVIGAFLIFVIFSCITSRRRRRLGHSPYRGTGWAAGATPAGHAPAQYTGASPQPYFANNNQAPPVYSPPVSNQGYYNQGHEQNQGYFGGQQQGVELQQPESAYAPQRGGEPVYDFAPPVGPPPGKKGGDGIIR